MWTVLSRRQFLFKGPVFFGRMTFLEVVIYWFILYHFHFMCTYTKFNAGHKLIAKFNGAPAEYSSVIMRLMMSHFINFFMVD